MPTRERQDRVLEPGLPAIETVVVGDTVPDIDQGGAAGEGEVGHEPAPDRIVAVAQAVGHDPVGQQQQAGVLHAARQHEGTGR